MNATNPRPTQATIDQYFWFHSIDFGNGVVSRGMKSHAALEQETTAYFQGLDLTGRSLLDVGAWNGAVSFAAKRRGAGRLVATDKHTWAHPRYRGRETFELGRSLLGLDIEAVEIDVPDLSPERVGTFEIVLFLGVFYHLFDAPTLTKRVSELATDLLILETHQDALELGRPGMIYYSGATLNGDKSNFWGPNPECIYEMLREIGFAKVFYQDSPYCQIEGPYPRGRGIFHAFKTEEALQTLCPSPEAKPWYDLSELAVRKSVFQAVPPQAVTVLATQLRDAQDALRDAQDAHRETQGALRDAQGALRDAQDALRDAQDALEATRNSRTMRLAQALKNLLRWG